MNYQPFTSALFIVYMSVCALAFLLSIRDRDATLQAFIYGLTIGLFQAFFGGKAHVFHFWWYGLNAAADAYIVVSALMIRARSSRWVGWIGVAALLLDLTYFGFSASGNKLPGIGYYYGSEVCETLQVLALLVFAPPVLNQLRRLGGLLVALRERIFPWTHRRLLTRY